MDIWRLDCFWHQAGWEEIRDTGSEQWGENRVGLPEHAARWAEVQHEAVGEAEEICGCTIRGSTQRRYAKLGENAGYGIDKMLVWEKLTKGKVDFASDLVSSTITYWFGGEASGTVSGTAREQAREQVGEQPREQVQRLVNVIREDACTLSEILKRLNLKGRRYVFMVFIKPAIEGGYVLRSYPDKPNHPQQRYYLSEKGLKLVK